MRIRKRLALCSVATPPPLSDLHLRRSDAPPPDQKTTWAFSKTEEEIKEKEFGDDHGTTNNDIRKIVNMCDASSSSLQDNCCEDDYKLVPLKKRKGVFERNTINHDETASVKMKSKTNKKCGENGTASSSSGGGGKKSKRGSVIMEGSRCSRVNGRGWRCCQPTLVGYSLCEHHLGKGRLRSVAMKKEEDSQSLFVVTKKRSKVGVVKARSISSLLSQI